MEETLHAHLRQPILKILHSHGIARASSVSLQVFASLLDKYLKSTLGSCQEYAGHAGRTNLSVYDVLESLEEMGTVLDDLKDYLEVDCGVVPRTGADGSAVQLAAEASSVQKYAKAVGPRKEAELHEFKESLRQGLPASEDRISERMRYTRLNTPDEMDFEPEVSYPRLAYSDSEDYDASPKQDKPVIQLPLSPISNSPPHGTSFNSRSFNDDSAEQSAIPSFLPPFPITSLDPENENSREKEEELKREAELQKQKEAEEQEKEKAEGAAVVQTFPANYIMPAPYEVSKLQARGTWHLPSLSLASMDEDTASSPLKTSNPQAPPVIPFVRGTSTTEELLSALHSLVPSTSDQNPPATPTFGPNAMTTNPLRHKVSIAFLGITPARYNTPDSLFGLNANVGPTPRPANPLPTHFVPNEHQPGVGLKGKNKDPELVLPPPQGRSVGAVTNVVNAVTGTSSRIPAVSRHLLAKPTLARTKRLMPPPPQKRDDRLLLYHTPNPPLPAHWNLAVSGSNSQYAGGTSTEPGKGKPERNPYGVTEATLAYTWDWNAKVPWEGLERVKGAAAPGAPGSTLNLNGLATPGGNALGATGIVKERTVPKISVNVPGRRSSTLSSVTPGPGTGLIARFPGLGERSPSHAGIMPPPPVPTHAHTPWITNGDQVNGHQDHEMDFKSEVESPMELVPETPLVAPPKPTRTLTLKLPQRNKDLSNNDKEILAISDPLQSALSKTGAEPIVDNADLDADIDAEIAEVMGEAKDEVDAEIEQVLGDPVVEDDEDEDADADADIDVDAYIADALGPEASPPVARSASSVSNPVSNAPEPPSQADLELEKLLEKSASPSLSRTSLPPPTVNGHDVDIDMLGGPPVPPGEGSAYILSDLDYLPASEAGTLTFASSTTIPLATSAFRSTTTPLPMEAHPHISYHPPTTNGILTVKSEEPLPMLDGVTPLLSPVPPPPSTARTMSNPPA